MQTVLIHRQQTAAESVSPKRQSFSWILLHSLAMGLFLVSLLSGLRIATVSRPDVLYFSALLPQGDVHDLHLLSATGLISVAAAYLFSLTFVRGKSQRKRVGIDAYHRTVIWLGRILLLTSLVSGILIYIGLFPSAALNWLHYAAALALLLFVLLHGGLFFVQHGVRAVKRITLPAPVRLWQDGWAVVVGISTLVVTSGLLRDANAYALLVKEIPLANVMQIDGVAAEPIWTEADAVEVHTFGGTNFIEGRTPITVKALHNGVDAFFFIEWEDPSESLRHLPLIKTDEGWKVTESGFDRFDETEHYEDKLAVMLSGNCDFGASGTAHLGPEPLAGKPPNWHGKGYHFAVDGGLRDVWHWKAVRTNDMFLADDNHFGAPDAVRSGLRRYTAGYLPDPKESGGYLENWQWYRPDTIVPKRLPKRPADLEPYQRQQDAVLSWWVPWYSYDLYDSSNDTYPVGTVMPSVLYASSRFEGDRADVRARGVWRNGRWSLELVRALDTGSSYDVALKQGICLWVAAFDHAQIAHTRHAKPVRLNFGGRSD